MKIAITPLVIIHQFSFQNHCWKAGNLNYPPMKSPMPLQTPRCVYYAEYGVLEVPGCYVMRDLSYDLHHTQAPYTCANSIVDCLLSARGIFCNLQWEYFLHQWSFDHVSNGKLTPSLDIILVFAKKYGTFMVFIVGGSQGGIIDCLPFVRLTF